MNTSRTTVGLAAALVALAGVSASMAQSQTREQTRDQTRDQQSPQQRPATRDDGRPQDGMTDRNREAGMTRTPVFVRASELLGADIEAMDGDDLGEIEDMIVDRGSGRIVALLVDPDDGWAGFDDKMVAVPFREFRWTGDGPTATLAMTPDSVKGLQTFDENQLKNRDRGAFQNVWRSTGGADRDADPYETRLGAGNPETIDGEIVAVERKQVENDDHVVLVVRTDAGQRRVDLGPSWYVLRQNPPMRGQRVTIEAVPVSGEQGLYAARTRGPEPRTTYRDDRNRPSWWENNGEASEQRANTGRLMLASEILGSDTIALGDDIGEINDLIVERGSGVIAFATIDPDENFLGIGDTNRLVPWQVVSFGTDGDAQLDASKDMILASSAMPDDIRSLNNQQVIMAIYRAYDVPAPSFTSARPQQNMAPGGRR